MSTIIKTIDSHAANAWDLKTPERAANRLVAEHKKADNPQRLSALVRPRSSSLLAADQVIEGTQGGLGALAHSNDDLLVRHSRHVTGSKHTRDIGRSEEHTS